jgi:imidazolonepropionase-like amidohydrolase
MPDLPLGPGFVVRGHSLPDGAPCELWIKDGRFVAGPLNDATPLCEPQSFVMPGLVESHSHISYPQPIDAPAHTPGWMNNLRRRYLAQGVLLMRDMGSASNHILALPNEPGLPKLQASGRVLLRHREPPMTPTEPDALVEAARGLVREGATWVKVFADWSDDFQGAADIGFGGSDPLAYPPEVLAELAQTVHAEGARVAAHCFTEAGARASVEAGIDTLEHGWGLSEQLIDQLVAQGGAWCPLLGIAPEIHQVSRRLHDHERLAWLEECLDRLRRLLPYAESVGLCVLAGTDRGPGMPVAAEVEKLVEFGLSVKGALDACGEAARTYLGHRSLSNGDPADLVLFEADPRTDLTRLYNPSHIIIDGRIVDMRATPSTARRPDERINSRRYSR